MQRQETEHSWYLTINETNLRFWIRYYAVHSDKGRTPLFGIRVGADE